MRFAAVRIGALIVSSSLILAGCAVSAPGTNTGQPSPAAIGSTVTPTPTPTGSPSTASASASPTPNHPTTASPTTSSPPKDKRSGAALATPFTVKGIIVVSKQHRVAASYGPPDPIGPNHLTRETAAALAKMIEAARTAGVRIVVRSGYRSYASQKAIYDRALRNYPSVASAKRYNAPPGASEHQTGLALDLWDGVTWSLPMANTATGKWLHKHCHEYGFVLRYPKGKEKVTGYSYEPWHFRYVGTAVAARFGSGNTMTLEEFLHLA